YLYSLMLMDCIVLVQRKWTRGACLRGRHGRQRSAYLTPREPVRGVVRAQGRSSIGCPTKKFR
ncbi:MAG: hypothetical protein ACK5UP_04030, partial [Bacteroidota bacterium]